MNRRIDQIEAYNALKSKLKLQNNSDLQTLSNGPNSVVFLDKRSNEVWKIPHSDQNTNPFLEEEKLSSLPDSDLIVGLKRVENLTVGRNEYRCLIFPYIAGDSMYELIKKVKKGDREAFSFDEIKNVGKKVSEAIAFLNKNGLIHQDIKPANIILCNDGSVKLIDLGIARYLSEDKQAIKKLEGPYSYLSPEYIGILSGHAHWHELTFASDLYSLGAVMFEMVKLERLSSIVPLQELYKSHSELRQLGIDDNTARYLSLFLQPEIFARQNDISLECDIRWWNINESRDRRLWLHSSKDVVKDVYPQFVEVDSPKSPLGLIYNAHQITSNHSLTKSRGKTFKSRGHLFAIDPSTYLQQHEVSKQKGLKNLSYGKVHLNPDIFLQDSAFFGDKYKYIDLVLEQQMNFDVSVLISPYFYLKNCADGWLDASFIVWEHSRDKATALNMDIYYGLMLSEDLIKSKTETHRLAMMLSQCEFLDKIYLRVESKRDSSFPLMDEQILDNLKEFIEYLSQTKSILLASSGVEALGLLSYGLDSISTNPEFSQRKFSLKSAVTKQNGGSQPIPRYFSRRLLNEVLVKAELDNAYSKMEESKFISLFTCECASCPNRDPISLKRHFLCKYDEMFSILLEKETKEEMSSEFKSWLDQARLGYDLLSVNNVKLENYSNGSFIEVWSNIF